MARGRNNTIKTKKRHMRITLVMPFLIFYIFTFTLLYTTLTVLDYTNSKRTITNSINKTIDNFALSLSLQVSANNSIVSNGDVLDYLDGNNTLESAIRAQLSAKVAQSPPIRANTIIPLNPAINSLSSYQISTFPSNEHFLDLFAIKTFMIREETSLFFLRHEVIPSSYDLVNYPANRGLCSLVDKIFDNGTLVGLLVSDYYSDRLYEEGLALSFPQGININFAQLQNSDNVLQATYLTQTFKERPVEGFNYKFLSDITVTNILRNENTIIYDLSLIVGISSQPLIIRNAVSFLILALIALVLYLVSYYFIKFTSNQIFDPLSKINDDIKKFLE